MSEQQVEPPELDDAAYQRALSVLLDVGTALAQELKSPAADLTTVQRATAFPGVATAVRRTIILSRHIASAPHAPAPAPQRAEIRRQIIRTVEDTIEKTADPADAGSLRVELLERLDSPELDAELTSRHPADLIQELCRDLGLSNRPFGAHFKRRTPDDIAILNAQAAAPAGSDLSTWLPSHGKASTPGPDRPVAERCPPS